MPSIIDQQSSLIDYNPSIRVLSGENAIDNLGELCRQFGSRRVLIVTDPGMVQAGLVERAVQSLQEALVDFFIFKDVEENPTSAHVENGVSFARENEPIDLIVGFGGGSAMDCAKGINFVLTNGGKMEDYWGFGKAEKPMLPSIGVPTTAGTGSEAQSFALIAHAETHQKMACGDLKARFRAVILDPTLLRTLPEKVAAITGIDAISHALESHVSTKSNPISRMFSREALRLLLNNFEAFASDRQNTQAGANMLLGAHWAGTAIENSMLGAAHACANPLTANFDIAHGIAVGLMLPAVILFNAEVANGAYAELASAAGLDCQRSAAETLAQLITEFATRHDLPTQLRAVHLSETELPELAQRAAKQWTVQFNPRKVTERELLELYEVSY